MYSPRCSGSRIDLMFSPGQGGEALKDHELALLRGQGVVLGPLVGEGKLPADLRVDVDAELGSAVRDELLDLGG